MQNKPPPPSFSEELLEKSGVSPTQASQAHLHQELSSYDCVLCKAVTGLALFAFGSLNVVRLSGGYFWSLPMKEKLFQLVATGGIYMLSLSQGYILYDVLSDRSGSQRMISQFNPQHFGFFGRLRGNFQRNQNQSREDLLQMIESEEKAASLRKGKSQIDEV